LRQYAKAAMAKPAIASHLGRNWSGEITIKIDHQLIRCGPYELLRHSGVFANHDGRTCRRGAWIVSDNLARRRHESAQAADWDDFQQQGRVRQENVNGARSFGF
jgi:hypothetical protein